MTTRAPAAALTDRELRLYTVLSRYAFDSEKGQNYQRPNWICMECGAKAPDKSAVRHAPGCVFWNLDADTLAAISADWTP